MDFSHDDYYNNNNNNNKISSNIMKMGHCATVVNFLIWLSDHLPNYLFNVTAKTIKNKTDHNPIMWIQPKNAKTGV